MTAVVPPTAHRVDPDGARPRPPRPDADPGPPRFAMPPAASRLASWCASGPVCVALALLLVLGRLIELGVRGRIAVAHGSVLAALLEGHHRPWALVTGWAGTGPQGPAISVVVLLTGGIALERYMGSRRFALAALTGHVLGIATLLDLHPVLARVWPAWGRTMGGLTIAGVGLPLAAALGGASALMGPRWRRRTRLVLLGVLTIVAAVTGTVSDVARALSALAGIALGAAIWRHTQPSTAGPSTSRSRRSLLALLVTGWALAVSLSLIAHAPEGPLSGARLGLAGGGRASLGAADVALALMPILLQLALADGLRRGRRAAGWGTIALQAVLAVSAVLSVAADRVRAGSALAPYSRSWLMTSDLAVPLLLHGIVILLVVWSWSALNQRTGAPVLRRALMAWAASTAASAAGAVLLGLTVATRFTPTAGVGSLLGDYLVRLLPASAAPLIRTSLVAHSGLAHVAVQVLPCLAWLCAVVIVLVAMLAPADHVGADPERLDELVRGAGAGTLGWMLTWPGNDAWVSPDGRCGFAYRSGSGVALTLSDPACAPRDVDSAVDGFAAFCREAGLVPALYSVHEPTMRAARARGWTVLQVAEEAVIDLPDLAFTGKAFQDVRTALNRAEREGMTAVWTSWRSAPEGRRDQIRAISQEWSGHKSLPEMGFTLGGLREIDDDETRLLLAVDAEGTIHAVTSWMPVYEDGEVVGLTLDLMRRRDGGWRPSIEYLIARAAQDARAQGLRLLSLSGAPLTSSSAPDGVDDAGASRFAPLLDLLSSLLEPAYGFSSLHSFKRKFKPRAVPMYLAVPETVDLATTGLAIARAYVPDVTPAQAARFAQVVIGRD